MYAFKSKLPSPLTVDAGADSGAAVLCILLLLLQLVLHDVDVNASTEEKDVARRTNPTLKEERMMTIRLIGLILLL